MQKAFVSSLVLAICVAASAQDSLDIQVTDAVVTVDEGQEAPVQFFSFAADASQLDVALPAVTATPVNGDFVSANFLSPFMPHDTLGIASSPQFMDELGIVDDQREQLIKLSRTISKARSDMLRSIHVKQKEQMKQNGGKPVPFDAQTFKKNEEEFKQQVIEGVDEILLPHQVKRLEQLKVQMKMKSQGARAIAGGLLADTLELTDEQRKELREKEREAQIELRAKIAKLREEAREKVLEEVLTPTQQDKLAELTGDKFEVKRPERRRRISNRGDGERASRKSKSRGRGQNDQ